MLHTREEVATTVVAYPPDPSINILRRVLHVPGARQFFVDCVDTVSLSCVKTFLNMGTPWTQEATELSWRLETCQHPGYLWSATERGPGTINWDFTRSCPETQFLSLLVITQIQIYIDDHFIAAVHVQISTFKYKQQQSKLSTCSWHFERNIGNTFWGLCWALHPPAPRHLLMEVLVTVPIPETAPPRHTS